MAKREKLGLKVLPEHKRALECIAKTEGEPVSVVLRRIIRAEAERRGLWPATPRGDAEPPEDPATEATR